MTEKKAEIKPKKTATKKITKVMSSRKGFPPEYRKKVAVRNVADCPYRQHKLSMPCDNVPGEMVCGTYSCWINGLSLNTYEIDTLTESQTAEMMRLLILADRKAFDDWAYANLRPRVLIV